MRSWDSSRNYGEFQGSFVGQRGSVKLRGKFVEVAGPLSSFAVGIAAAVISIVTYSLISDWQGGAAFDWSKLGFGVFILLVVFVGVALLKRLSAGHRRRNVLAEAELLIKDIKRALK